MSANVKNLFISFLLIVFHIYYFILAIACTIRRLHDTNRSAWYIIWFLMPGISVFWVIYFLFAKPSDMNNYGKSPRLLEEDEDLVMPESNNPENNNKQDHSKPIWKRK